jgi:D-glycero-D-manno-heptose 1,7-bisphosphate phosphatase
MYKNFNKCVFFDRDGVLNKDKGYISKVNDIEIFSKVGKAIHECNKNKYLVIIITNQSGIGRGLISLKQLNQIHSYIKKEIKKNKAIINDIFFCPYHPSAGKGKYKRNSYDRKPNPGMLFKAIKKWKIDPKKSFMIGDKVSDRTAAKAAGLKFFFKSKKINLYRQIKHIIKN